MKYAIETISLTKVFADWWGRNKVFAVEDLDLKVNYNEVFGFLGPNGSGKTTTLKLLLGLLHPTKGRAIVLGGDATNAKISARIGFMPEESYLYKYLNARETLDFYGRLFGLSREVRRARTETLLEMVGLKAVAGRAVGTYSKGMARRIGLAQALINDPELLILDEPTTGLDPIGTRQIKELIIELAARGKTVLLCSHLLADVEDICDRIAILYGGKIQKQGKVQSLLQQSGKRQITAENIPDELLEKVKNMIRQSDPDCAVTVPMDKLENFFIKTVEQARLQNKTTSGAVSTTDIGDFLRIKPQKSIIDSLVNVDVKQQSGIDKEDVQTQQPTVQATAQPEPDRQLLKDLTESETDTTETVITAAEPAPEPIEEQQIKTDIIEKLAGRKNPQHDRQGDTENNLEDSKNE